MADWQQERTGGIGKAFEIKPLILLPPRDWLYRRCDARFAAMLEQGAIDEARRLLERRLAPSLPAMRAIGVREIADHLAGRTSREELLAAGQLATRRYAKRQYTWFRHQPPGDWPRFGEPLEGEAVEQALAILQPRSNYNPGIRTRP